MNIGHTVEKWQLKEMQNHQQREESVEVNIEAVTPLYVLPPWWLDNQVSVRH